MSFPLKMGENVMVQSCALIAAHCLTCFHMWFAVLVLLEHLLLHLSYGSITASPPTP